MNNTRPLRGLLTLASACLMSCRSAAPATPAPDPSPIIRSAPVVVPLATMPHAWAALDSGPVQATIFVATTRRAVASARPGERFGAQNSDSLQFAAVAVNVPAYAARGVGNLPRPSASRDNAQAYRPDPARDFYVAAVSPMDSTLFVSRIAADLATTTSRNLLVFVHGAKTTFDDAAVRAAQIAADIGFDGSVLLFSWPSAGPMGSYAREQSAARAAGPQLRRLLRGHAASAKPDRLDLLAYATGSEVVGTAITQADRGDSLSRLGQLVFAAPDLDARVFRRDILPRVSGRANRISLYAADDDEGLRASRVVNVGWRLGLGGDSLTIIEGMDTIDASRVRADTLGHTLFADRSFLADLSVLFIDNKAPADRRLLSMNRGGLVYWKFVGNAR